MDEHSVGSSKLMSLLALSAGAFALPQGAEAGIHYSGIIDEKVGLSGGFNSSYTLDLPGSAALQLIAMGTTIVYNMFSRLITAQVNFVPLSSYARVRAYLASNSRAFAGRNSAGPTWDQLGASFFSAGGARIESRTTHIKLSIDFGNVLGAGSFTDKYIAFRFQDSTAGNADRYGWALMSMSVSGHPNFPASGPDVTLTSYAYDDTGAKIAMGAIPEPSSAALAAFGALALGGVRRWRASKRAS